MKSSATFQLLLNVSITWPPVLLLFPVGWRKKASLIQPSKRCLFSCLLFAMFSVFHAQYPPWRLCVTGAAGSSPKLHSPCHRTVLTSIDCIKFIGVSLIMKQYMENRILSIAHYTIDHSSTVRSTARKFGISKSTVHKDLTERLPQIDHHLAEEVRDILEVNKSERHIRGGLATRQKYLQMQR